MPRRNLVSILIVITVIVFATMRQVSWLDHVNNWMWRVLLLAVFLTLGIILSISAIKKQKR